MHKIGSLISVFVTNCNAETYCYYWFLSFSAILLRKICQFHWIKIFYIEVRENKT